LCANNSDWIQNGIQINDSNLEALADGIPQDLPEVVDAGQSGTTIDEVVEDTGPVIADNGPVIQDDELESDQPTHTFVESNDLQNPVQIDRIGDFINWPQANPTPINEFEYDGLCSLVFPSLFPYGKGDPTKKSRLQKVSETDGFKHLLRYTTLNSQTNLQYYPFAKHPRFKFWAYDRLRRHRSLDQAKIYLHQNLGKKYIFE
jgi:hypothetical protein